MRLCQDKALFIARPRRHPLNQNLIEDTQALLGARLGDAGATRRVALKAALDAARLKGDFLEEDECRRRYGIDRARIEEEREVKRERVRSGG